MDWILEGVFQAGTVNGIFGVPTVGKSTFMREFALRIARGEPFLGRPTKKANVLIYSLEDNRENVKLHMDKLATPGQPQGEPIAFIFEAPPRNSFTHLCGQLEADIKEADAEVVFIDPIQYFFHIQDVNNYSEVAEALACLNAVRAKTGTTLFPAHHVGKNFERGAVGSIVWESVRTSLFIGLEAENTRFIKTRTHTGQPIPKTYLRLMPDGALRLEGTPAEMRQEDVYGRLIKVVSAEAGLEQDIVIERASLSRNHAVDGLHELEQIGAMRRTGKGVRGDPIRWWLPNQTAPQ